MFTRRATSGTRKSNQAPRNRRVLEVLETRKLMAGDMNLGSYVIGGGDIDISRPPAVVQSLETAAAKATVALPTGSAVDPAGIDAVLTGDQSWMAPGFLPSCPALKADNTTADANLMRNVGTEPNTIGPIKPATPPQTIGTLSGTQGSRDRSGASQRAANENRSTLALSATSIHAENFMVSPPGGRGAASRSNAKAEEFRYFTADGSQPSADGPSLANQSLSPYVQSDTFMAMGLLPPPLTADPQKDSSFAMEPETQSYQTRSARFDGWNDDQDLDSLREDASVIDTDETVDPLPFLGVATHSISAAMVSFVGMDFYDLDAESIATEDASLVDKLNKNRYQFAAFAFVFTIVTVRMSSTDSKREEPKSDDDQKPSRVPN